MCNCKRFCKIWGHNQYGQLGSIDYIFTDSLDQSHIPLNVYNFLSSGASCTTPEEGTLYHGQAKGYFLNSSSDCWGDNVQKRVCVNGTLTGTYTNLTCEGYSWSSCPLLFFKDGSSFTYLTDLAGGSLGARRGTIPTFYEKTEIVVPIVPKNNIYEFYLSESMDEISYVDNTKLLLVDHPEDYEIVITGLRRPDILEYENKIYTVKPISPSLVLDREGRNVTEEILYKDNLAPEHDLYEENIFYIYFDDIQGNEYSKLLLDVWTYNKTDQERALDPYTDFQTTSTISILDEENNWVVVNEWLRSTGDFMSLTIELGDVFLSDNKVIKLNVGRFTSINVIDRIRYDESVPASVTITEVLPFSAILEDNQVHLFKSQTLFSSIQSTSNFIFKTPEDTPQFGRFTKLGEVLPLLLDVDDIYVIMRKGDKLTLKFEAPEKNDEKRTVIFSSKTYYNVAKFGESAGTFYTLPLPFKGMSSFPYDEDIENYPNTEEHNYYDSFYNTRVFEEN